jgi:hypothetical protein
LRQLGALFNVELNRYAVVEQSATVIAAGLAVFFPERFIKLDH